MLPQCLLMTHLSMHEAVDGTCDVQVNAHVHVFVRTFVCIYASTKLIDNPCVDTYVTWGTCVVCKYITYFVTKTGLLSQACDRLWSVLRNKTHTYRHTNAHTHTCHVSLTSPQRLVCSVKPATDAYIDTHTHTHTHMSCITYFATQMGLLNLACDRLCSLLRNNTHT